MTDLLAAHHATHGACKWPHEVEHEDMMLTRKIEGDPPEGMDRVPLARKQAQPTGINCDF